MEWNFQANKKKKTKCYDLFITQTSCDTQNQKF